MKFYEFEVKITYVGAGYLEANSLEEAKQKILDGDYDDIYDIHDHEIVDIIDVKETEDEAEED